MPIVMGRDTTGDMQINDTYLDSPLKSVYWEREIFNDRATKNGPRKNSISKQKWYDGDA